MKWKSQLDPRTAGALVLWLDDQQASGLWSATVGPNATQSATNNQPALGVIATRPALSFDGINDSLVVPALSLATWHAFAVVNAQAAGVVVQVAASSSSAFTLSASATGLQLLSVSGAPANTASAFGADSRIGAGWEGGALRHFYKGLIGEVLIYAEALTAGQALAVSRYLSAKWGV